MHVQFKMNAYMYVIMNFQLDLQNSHLTINVCLYYGEIYGSRMKKEYA